MIPKKGRISRENFPNVFQKGNIYSTNLLTLRFVASKTPTNTFSVVVSKQVAAKAVDRNLIRRRIYSILQNEKIPPGALVVFCKKGLKGQSFATLKREINQAIKAFI